jgi:hypothetical protein
MAAPPAVMPISRLSTAAANRHLSLSKQQFARFLAAQIKLRKHIALTKTG